MSESGMCDGLVERGLALTQAQQDFVTAYVATHRALDAYRLAFDVPEAVSDEVVWHEASAVLGNHDVILRIMELQEEVARNQLGSLPEGPTQYLSDADIRALTHELEKARVKAMGDEKGANTAVSATMGKAKLLGLLSERREPPTKGAPSGVTVAVIDFAKMRDDRDGTSG
ncbi:MAG: hypothetical protein V7703_07640 [Hyphomicrobiales bacterium]